MAAYMKSATISVDIRDEKGEKVDTVTLVDDEAGEVKQTERTWKATWVISEAAGGKVILLNFQDE